MATVGTLTVQMTLTSAEFEKGMKDAQALTARGANVIVRSVDDASKSVAVATRGMNDNFARVAVSVRSVSLPLARELAPALGETVSGFGAAITAARGFGIAGGALVATAAVATSAITQFVSSLVNAAEKQAALNHAVRGFDAGALRSALEQASLEIEKAQERSRALWQAVSPSRMIGQFKADVSRFFTEGISGSLAKAKSEVQELFTGASRAAKDLAAAQAALAKVRPFESEKQTIEGLQKQQQAVSGLLQVESQRAQTAGDLEEFLALQNRLKQAYDAEYGSAVRLIDLEAQAARAAAQTRGEPTGLIDQKAADARQAQATSHVARLMALQESTRATAQAIQAPVQAGIVAAAQAVLDEAEQEQRMLAEFAKERAADAQRILQIDVERLDVQMGLRDLTRDEAEALERRRIEAERIAALADPRLARNDAFAQAQRGAIEYRAELQQNELATREWREVSRDLFDELRGGLVGLAQGADNVGDAMVRMAMRSAAAIQDYVLKRTLEPVEKALTSLLARLADAGMGALFPAASGGATVARAGPSGLTGAGVETGVQATFFAEGGIVNRPMLGVLAERGPEAVVPLDQYNRGGMGGGGTSITIIDQRGAAAPAPEVRETMRDGRRDIEILIADTVDKAMAGGRFDRSLAMTYGVNRRGARG